MESVAAQIRANFAALGALSSALSLLDVLCAFAVRVMSSKGAYVRPVFGDDESPLAVEAGRYLSFYLFSVLEIIRLTACKMFAGTRCWRNFQAWTSSPIPPTSLPRSTPPS